ncbi:MAG TPA: hypothetical protein VFA46_07310 [Actinomycetes bacterium]|nr:hypothetical protein [Actinomycetes bacterium]
MFLNLAKLLEDAGGTREQVFLIHPVQLSRWLDEAWAGVAAIPPLPIGSPPGGPPLLGSIDIVDALDLPQQPLTPPPLLLPSGIVLDDVTDLASAQAAVDTWAEQLGPTAATGRIGLLWHHLSYAYVIESTGIFEIFAEIVRRLVVGETLGELSPASIKWVRATEELFFRDPPLFSITGTVSELRPHARVSRRNAYWRMFGMDVPHAIPAQWDRGGQAWKVDVGEVNVDFRAKWTELLRQVWLGLENNRNSSGANPTDGSYVALLCRALRDMFNDRRRGGLLAREEFAYVTVLSWFHLTVQSDTPIVVDLKAQSTSPAERLSLLGQRVGMHPAQRARELFDLSEPMSSLLRAIEVGSFDDAATAATLFDVGTALGQEMREIINQWQSATGERIKEWPTGTVTPVASQPLRVPTPRSGTGVVTSTPKPAAAPAPAAAATNGQRT